MTDNSKPKFVITIGRQFGSGGREIGRLVAQMLKIDYYDKELLTEAAKSTGMNSDFFEAADERSPKFFSSLMSFSTGFHGGSFVIGNSPISNDNIYRQQSEVIEALAERNSGSHCRLYSTQSPQCDKRIHTCRHSYLRGAHHKARPLQDSG